VPAHSKGGAGRRSASSSRGQHLLVGSHFSLSQASSSGEGVVMLLLPSASHTSSSEARVVFK